MYIGHDAELEVVDEKGEAVPAHEFFPPKSQPVLTGYRGDVNGGGYHQDGYFRDGTSLELNTPGAMSCFAGVSQATVRTMTMARSRLPEGFQLNPISAYEMKKDLSSAPPDVVDSGCHPVRNAHEGWEERSALMDPSSKIKLAGGHIHLGAEAGYYMSQVLGNEKLRPKFCEYVVKYLDLYVGVPMVYTGIEGEAGTIRRRTYGLAGEYRYQEYRSPAPYKLHGIEYRVLGPEWLKDIGLMALAFNLARGVAGRASVRFQDRETRGTKTIRWSSMVGEAREAINKGDTKEVFESPAYQKKFQRVLETIHISRDRFQIKHIKFIRENRERLFPRAGINEFPQNTNNNWPECLDRWGYR